MQVTSAATAMTGNLANFTLSGSNANNTGAVVQIDNTGTLNANTGLVINHYATGTGNLAMRVNDVSGDTTPFVIDGDGEVGIGTATPASLLDIQAGTTLKQTAINAVGSINDFFQFNIQNTSTGTGAQSGFSATADNGTATTNFAWIGINNSAFSSVQPYNIGGAGDVEFLGAGNDMYIANNSTTKDIIFSTGKIAASYFDERMRIKNSGLIGIGTASPTEKLTVAGNIMIGAQADTATTGSSTATTNPAAGTFGAQTSIDRARSSVVFKGKLFVATAETDLAGVYRYDGGTTWTLVTNATPGKAVAGDTANIDAFVMTVHGDRLYIGSQTGAATNTGAVYYSTTADTTADSFTLLNATRGTFASANQDGVSDMAVYNGDLIIATQEPNLAEIVRYTGGTTFSQINLTDGKTVAETTADKDGHILEVFDGYLFVGSISGAATNVVAVWNGAVSTPAAANWVNISVALTGGTYGDQTSMSDTNSMVVHNGSLYVSMSKTAGNAAAVFRYTSTGLPLAATGATRFNRINTTVGKLIAGDAADQDSILLYSYNGRLYGGSTTGSTTGALYEYTQTGAGAEDWVLMNTTRGTFGADTSVDGISTMVAYNDTLYIGTFKSNAGSVYTWSKTAGNSYGLKFDSGSSNYAEISFVGGEQKSDNGGQQGTFIFSHAVSLKAGGFDYAEDYPTYDETLAPGDVVAIDPGYVEYIKRADGTTPAIGIFSKNPGLRLQKPDDVVETGERWVPIALVGRVPVKVSTENGPIKAGDSLTLSETIPGVAMKATKAGTIIARALSKYEGTEVGTVTAFIDNSYSNGSKLENILNPGEVTAEDGSVTLDHPTLNSQALLAQFMAQKAVQKEGATLSDVYVDRVAAGLEIITPTVTADTIDVNN
jgi:hypothetical protein